MRTASSIEAYVLPEVVDLTPPHEGRVIKILVRERDLVTSGQDLLEIECDRERVMVKASVSGVVWRCSAGMGDAVGPSRSLVSIIRAEDVLVVARFHVSAAHAVRNARAVSVRIPGARADAMPAMIIGSVGTLPWEAIGAPHQVDGAVRVIARLHAPVLDALWPGMEAIVDIAYPMGGGV